MANFKSYEILKRLQLFSDILETSNVCNCSSGKLYKRVEFDPRTDANNIKGDGPPNFFGSRNGLNYRALRPESFHGCYFPAYLFHFRHSSWQFFVFCTKHCTCRLNSTEERVVLTIRSFVDTCFTVQITTQWHSNFFGVLERCKELRTSKRVKWKSLKQKYWWAKNRWLGLRQTRSRSLIVFWQHI